MLFKDIDQSWLKIEYLEKKRDTVDIGNELGVRPSTLRRWLIKMGIHRPRINCTNSKFEDIDPAWLKREYVDNKRSLTDIGQEKNASAGAVYEWLKKIGIVCRDISTAKKGTIVSEETRRKLSISHMGHKSYTRSAEHRSRLSEARKGKHVIWSDEARKRNSERRRKHSDQTKHKIAVTKIGSKNPSWRGGVSFAPYCPRFNNAFKENIREKFGRKCFVCGAPEGETRHPVHHIDYNKNSICNGKEWAFVPLCRRQHNNSNVHRFHWFNLLICYWLANPETNFDSEGINYAVRYGFNIDEGAGLAAKNRAN